MRRLAGAVLVAAVALSASAAQCRYHGCLRYARADTHYCALHLPEARQAAREAAAEAYAERKAAAKWAAQRRADEQEAQQIAARQAAAGRKLKAEQLARQKEEAAKFAQPLEGLFGHRLGEPIVRSVEPVLFEPKMPFREYEGYSLVPDASGNHVGAIVAYRDFGNDSKLVRAELDAVLLLLQEKYGRKLNKIFTKSGNEVYGLGFGAVDGMAHQMLQVALKPRDKGYRIVISASTIETVGRTLVEQKANDLKAL